MRTYICGIHPRGKAFELGVFKPGDQLLKVGQAFPRRNGLKGLGRVYQKMSWENKGYVCI